MTAKTEKEAALEKRLARIQKLIDAGVSSTKHGDEQINMRSYDELKSIKTDMMDELEIERGRSRRRKNAFIFRGRKGF